MSYNRIIILLLTTTLLTYCSNPARPAKKRIIALQSIGHYDQQQLQFIRKELQQFFKTPIFILKETGMPASFINMSKGERYSADSIIKWLAHTAPDSISQVVGFTHKDIFTTRRENGHIKEPESTYAVWGIFGQGYMPGRSCVVSDHRLQTSDNKRFKHRLRTVVIHEIGHNMGLPHCPSKNCIMSDANERIQTVDNSADDYCKGCKERLYLNANALPLQLN
ncbi:matrixin family metalloprotease [Niastella caeni]|uniref:Matrixin family metalloprotease n=1 Tax=Niastella caeni TaxID=2569763 RepID=A0A4S8HVL6_9BACT|nr:matrixin family metalloprotease [Niastella caeni]THU39677.1 matrixin family metalloprotease [Niastella caeni]